MKTFEEKRGSEMPAGVVVLKDGKVTHNYLDLSYPQNITVTKEVKAASASGDSNNNENNEWLLLYNVWN